MSDHAQRYDVIVVGGGSAGCVLAARLSETPSLRVLLIEAGRDTEPDREPADIRHPFYVAAYNPEYAWPDLKISWSKDPSARRRETPYTQARVLGGGSSINSMVALRGHPSDFDAWARVAGPEWAWDRIEPYYRKLENDLNFTGAEHSQSGPIPIRRHDRKDWPPFCRAMETELRNAGYGFVPDINLARKADGYCAVPMNNLPDRRVSAAMAYLTAQVRRRPNLHLLTGTHVSALVFEGRAAVGVKILRNGLTTMIAASEVIVACGALHSPALLMRSGIGPADDLRTAGVEVLADLPGVGRNLQEHPSVTVAALLRRSAMQPRSVRAHGNLSLRYSSGMPGCDALDMYLVVSNKTSWHALGNRLGYVSVLLQQPFSRGVVKLRAGDPFGGPDVDFNILADTRDLDRIEDGIRRAVAFCNGPAPRGVVLELFLATFSERVRRLNRITHLNALQSRAATWMLSGPAGLRHWFMDHVIAPGAHADRLLLRGRDDFRAWIRQNATGFYHVAGTCRLGHADDAQAVVGPDCRVHGVSGLRVADASIMPTVVKSQTNLSAIMIGEKVADIIRNEHRAAPALPDRSATEIGTGTIRLAN